MSKPYTSHTKIPKQNPILPKPTNQPTNQSQKPIPKTQTNNTKTPKHQPNIPKHQNQIHQLYPKHFLSLYLN